jgi:ligand-binding sensor domain-containing protein
MRARRPTIGYFVSHSALILSTLFAVTSNVKAEQLPLRTYTTADGLARDQINRIVRDSRGYLWFCTEEGLSRFDGYQFTNYTQADGLPNRNVTDLLETRSGVYWVATAGGLCRLNPSATRSGTEPKFVSQPQDFKMGVWALIEDRAGNIWCGTDTGLQLLAQVNGGWAFQSVKSGLPPQEAVGRILEDHRGALLISTNIDLYRRWPDGRTERFKVHPPLPVYSGIKAILEDISGQFWVGTTNGLCQLVADPGRPVVARKYTTEDGLAGNWVVSLVQSSDGKLWIGTNGGLSELIPAVNHNHPKFRSYKIANGPSYGEIQSLGEDHDGNLWMGIRNGGAMKIARNGFTTFDLSDGLGSAEVAAIIEGQAGELYAISAHQVVISRFDGRRFLPVQPDIPKRFRWSVASTRSNFGWGWNQTTFQDRAGEWWVATGQGLCRFPWVSSIEQLAYTRPKAVYTTRNGLMGNDVFRLFEDSHGDIWISTGGHSSTDLTKWQRATETFCHYSEADGLSSQFWAISFCEDTAGNLWIGSASQGLARYASGRFRVFTEGDGVPKGWIRALHLDSLGRLWIATGQGGLARIDDTRADHPASSPTRPLKGYPVIK